MAYSLCWLAVHGKVTDMILDELQLRRTGEREKSATKLAGAELPTGWYVVVKDQDVELMRDHLLKEISLQCECVACFVEDRSHTASAVGWKNGRKVWSALHDGQQGKEHLTLRGEFPALFGPILEGFKAKQKASGGDFYFDIPIELAREITGYRHDLPVVSKESEPFEILQWVPPQKGKK